MADRELTAKELNFLTELWLNEKARFHMENPEEAAKYGANKSDPICRALETVLFGGRDARKEREKRFHAEHQCFPSNYRDVWFATSVTLLPPTLEKLRSQSMTLVR